MMKLPPFPLDAPALEGRPLVICSDFDGTITQRDAIVVALERFAPMEWKAITHRILHERSLTVREGLPMLYDLIPSAWHPEINAYLAEAVQLREGFPEFMAWRQALSIPFKVVSGGLDAFIHPLLTPWQGQYTLYSNVASFEAETIGVETPYAPEDCSICGTCGCCKIRVLEAWPAQQFYRVAVGDSVTDFGMAQVADLVFARSALAKELDSLGVHYIPYRTFHEIQAVLSDRLVNPSPPSTP
jgi:2-hydroxy-3-keto-5-methylthiopentenyl-1-phosphate phosphatase